MRRASAADGWSGPGPSPRNQPGRRYSAAHFASSTAVRRRVPASRSYGRAGDAHDLGGVCLGEAGRGAGPAEPFADRGVVGVGLPAHRRPPGTAARATNLPACMAEVYWPLMSFSMCSSPWTLQVTDSSTMGQYASSS